MLSSRRRSSIHTATLKDQAPHIAYNQRVITPKLPNMSQEIIDKLDCKNEKNSTLLMGDRVCNDLTELKDINLGRRRGRDGAPSVSACVCTTVSL